MISVCLVDDQNLVRQGVRSLLDLDHDIRVVAECADGAEALRDIPRVKPDVVLLDLRMPDIGGLEVLHELSARHALPPTIILTTFDDDQLVLQGIKAGARGYLLKDVSLQQLVDAVRVVAGGGSLVAPMVSQRLTAGVARMQNHFSSLEHPDPLTERETEILRLLSGGYSNKEIANSLRVAEGTVRTTFPTSCRNSVCAIARGRCSKHWRWGLSRSLDSIAAESIANADGSARGMRGRVAKAGIGLGGDIAMRDGVPAREPVPSLTSVRVGPRYGAPGHSWGLAWVLVP